MKASKASPKAKTKTIHSYHNNNNNNYNNQHKHKIFTNNKNTNPPNSNLIKLNFHLLPNIFNPYTKSINQTCNLSRIFELR